MAATIYETSRQIDQNYYVEGDSDRNILKRMESLYNQYISQTQAFWNEARMDQRFYAGDQTLWNEIYNQIPAFRRRQFNFNKIRRIVNMISGHQRKHRKSTVVSPMESSDEETAEQFTDIINWAYKRDNVYNTISNAFEHGALVSGLSLLSVWLDRTEDPSSGDIRVSHLAYNSYMLDTFFRNQDLSDCNFLWTRKWLTKQEIACLLPDREEEIMKMPPLRYNKDQRFYFMPENYNFTIKDLYPYDEFWYQDTRKAKMLYDQETGESMEWPEDAESDALRLFLAQEKNVKVVKRWIPTTRVSIVVSNRVFYDGPNYLGIDRYPFVPVVGYWDPDSIYFQWRLQGVVRGLRDAQYLYNRRKVIELDMLESQINSGMKVMEGSLVDPNDVLKSGQGQPIFIKSTAPQGMDSVQQILPPQVPPTTIQLSQLLASEINEISGVNEELLGSAVDDKAGILSMLRQGAGLVTLEKLFDQLDLSQKLLGEITMDIVQKNFTKGKVERILGKPASPQFENKAFQKYDCVVTEGLLTDTQQKLEFIQLSQMKEMGLPIPSDILIDKAPIHGKKELKESIAKIEQAQAQQQQQMSQLQMQQMDIQNKSASAYSDAQQSLAAERLAKIQLDQAVNAERLQRSEEEKTGGILNLIKAIKELEGMDIEQIARKIEIVKALGEKDETAKESSVQGVQAPQ